MRLQLYLDHIIMIITTQSLLYYLEYDFITHILSIARCKTNGLNEIKPNEIPLYFVL
jgi:hypothetical protein